MTTTNEIISELKAINKNLHESVDIFNLYFNDGKLPQSKQERLKELKQLFSFSMFHEIIKPIVNDKQLTNNIVYAIFFDLWQIAIDLFECNTPSQTDPKLNALRVKVIKYGDNVDFYLDALSCLRCNLNDLHIFFISDGIPNTANPSEMICGINLDFEDFLISIFNEKNLTVRKNLILNKLHNSELLLLSFYHPDKDVEEEFKKEFEDFNSKCRKAIESIDFHLLHAQPAPIEKANARSIFELKHEIALTKQPITTEEPAECPYTDFSHLKQLTESDTNNIKYNCKELNDTYLKGVHLFENLVLQNDLTNEEISFLQNNPFSNLISDDILTKIGIDDFGDPSLGNIVESCFNEIIIKSQSLDCTLDSPKYLSIVQSKISTLNNTYTDVIINSFALLQSEIHLLFHYLYSYTGNNVYINFHNYLSNHQIKIPSNANIQDSHPLQIELVSQHKIDTDILYNYFAKTSNKELYPVDKLEIELANFASTYLKLCLHNFGSIQYNPNFFDAFIKEELLLAFVSDLHTHITPLRHIAATKYLNLAIQQFKTYTPEKRKSKFNDIIKQIYFYPQIEVSNHIVINSLFIDHVWQFYNMHFHLFQAETQSILSALESSDLIHYAPEEISKRPDVDILDTVTPTISTAPNKKKTNVKDPPLIDFLHKKEDLEKLLLIQENFSCLEGKKLAILIHLLQTEKKIISIIRYSKTHSRSHFIRSFKMNPNLSRFQPVNNFFDPQSDQLSLTSDLKMDHNYKILKEKLLNLLA